jgi:hypothetical protein
MPRKPDTFIRRIPLDLTRELAPQLAELADDPDPAVARWAAEALARELARERPAAARLRRLAQSRRERPRGALRLVRKR